MPKVALARWQYEALNNPYDHFAMFAGVACGKSYTGSHFAIRQMLRHPEMTGLIGANTYDQLSQASLRELFYWLDEYGLDYVVDCRPPRHWRCRRALKTYKNTIHVRNPKNGRVALAFTRVLSNENALRGIEISWYWLDETRDMPEIVHDVVISRMRETDNYARGIITTTTNGEDWSYRRFFINPRNGDPDDTTYGSMHVPTSESLRAGIITAKYYETMLKSYSPMMALQELDAQHVNVAGGRAYYSASPKNAMQRAPWGDAVPNRERPLIIGCDFNFSPAPMVWMVGQVGPAIYGPKGEDYSECIHWFGELSGAEIATPEMASRVLGQYPGFFYRFYGDASGGVGTTSNAGVTDYNQISEVMVDAGAMCTIDRLQADEEESRANPRVKSRVENMNRMFCNAIGEVRQTYDPQRCPFFDGDVRMVGWKSTTTSGRGKLDDGGDKDRTHATDGGGYAVYKLFPPGQRATIVKSLPSTLRTDYDLLGERRASNQYRE